MIPIRDTLTSRNRPVVNQSIIAVNVLVYLLQSAQGADLNRFIYVYGLVPARYAVPEFAEYFSGFQQVFAFLSFMFLHGGFWHLAGNMWSLWIFGDNVEDQLGPLRYLLFYLLCGICSGLAHMVLNLHSNVPTIGASGAISGVMGAYMLLHPNARILTLIPIIIFPWFVEIPAFFFLGLWFLLQFLNAAGSAGAVTGVAWWAHIGGFVCGMLFLKLFKQIPHAGISQRVRPMTTRKTSPRLQMVRPVATGADAHTYGTLTLTPYEAAVGAQKTVNVPWGFQKRLVRVNVPPGIAEGKSLRLQGMGKISAGGARGDLFLKIKIRGPLEK
ncbi:MAG: rhomboid family intramembrane serine protease [Desulfobacterales bacterium]|jgi:membrane associated rhomboid family serine protease